MPEQSVTSAAGVARTILAICAWMTLGLVVAVGILGPDPGFAALIRVPGAILVICLWGAAIWHEWLDSRRRNVPKWLVLLLLVFGNFVAAFLYYFLFVLWRKHSSTHGGPSKSAA
jgi:drug/metabolite transporter (DMT)-like permease